MYHLNIVYDVMTAVRRNGYGIIGADSEGSGTADSERSGTIEGMILLCVAS